MEEAGLPAIRSKIVASIRDRVDRAMEINMLQQELAHRLEQASELGWMGVLEGNGLGSIAKQ